MRTARTLGIPMSEWDGWDEEDQAWFLALDQIEQEATAQASADEAARCPLCGGPAGECQDPANQHAFDTEMKRCYRTKAKVTAMNGRKNDPHAAALLVSSRYNPARRKTSRKP